MIQHILFLIVNQLNSYILSLNPGTTPPIVVAGNIGLATTFQGNEIYMDNKIVVSVVNIMEEGALKNSSPYRSSSMNPEIENPPIYVNLFLLITANFNTGGTPDASATGKNYYNGLSKLSQVVEFFQGKNFITIQDSPVEDPLIETKDGLGVFSPDLQELSINMELVSLTFEQSNYLWGSLGGKQLPFVMYKAHVLPVKRNQILDRGAAIQDIHSTSLHLSRSVS